MGIFLGRKEGGHFKKMNGASILILEMPAFWVGVTNNPTNTTSISSF
jgi:hypothetical protein